LVADGWKEFDFNIRKILWSVGGRVKALTGLWIGTDTYQQQLILLPLRFSPRRDINRIHDADNGAVSRHFLRQKRKTRLAPATPKDDLAHPGAYRINRNQRLANRLPLRSDS
jgi:hypothetical protein